MLRTDRVIGLVWIGAEFVLSRFTSHFSWLLGGGADWFLTGFRNGCFCVRFWCCHAQLFQQFTPKLKSLFDEEFHGCSQPYGKLFRF